MKRREFLGHATILAAGLATTAKIANAAEKTKSAPSALLVRSAEAVKMLPRFAETAAVCATSGEVCLQYCQEQLAKGDLEFANCATATAQMAVLCESVGKLAALKSVRLAETLDACTNACKACKESCEEHKEHWKHGMHLECKSCAEHCDRLMAEVNKLKAAMAKA